LLLGRSFLMSATASRSTSIALMPIAGCDASCCAALEATVHSMDVTRRHARNRRSTAVPTRPASAVGTRGTGQPLAVPRSARFASVAILRVSGRLASNHARIGLVFDSM
jgi:hypothetical protein